MTSDAARRPHTHPSPLASLAPGYFALVMATGIVSIGLADVGLDVASTALMVLASAAYVVLLLLNALRVLRHPAAVRHDLRDPATAFSFFTVVAATDVLAVRLLPTSLTVLGLALTAVGALLWLVLGYVLPFQVLMRRDGMPILQRANGTWFIWSVASQSLAVALAGTQEHLGSPVPLIGLGAVLSWAVGAVLYAGIAVLVVLRVIHYGVTAREFEPPYWVALGAAAIAVVAGSAVFEMTATPMVDAARGVIGGMAVVFWSFAAWLLPPMIGIGVWRHVLCRVPLRYTAGLWSLVFPLGMFAVASLNLGRTEGLPLIAGAGEVLLAVAVLVWAVVAAAMTASLLAGARRRSRPALRAGSPRSLGA